MKLIFATNNKNKVEEIKNTIPSSFEIITLTEAGIDKDIPEPFDTLEENAREKAKTIFEFTGENCMSEDTGLEVFALDGAPGVHSARYAGESKSFEKNIEKLLKELQFKTDKKAQFRTIICLIKDGKENFFEGICKGEIISVPKGQKGFGYDPVFIPEGATKTFAEMSIEEKNKYSHRRKAVDKLVTFLNNLN
jgi:XTP/dITP diphosphohydrolase